MVELSKTKDPFEKCSFYFIQSLVSSLFGSRCILSVQLPRNFQYKYGSMASRVSYQHLSTSVNMYQHSIYMQQHIATLAKFNCLENFHKKIGAYLHRSLNQHMSTLVNMYQHSSNMLHHLSTLSSAA